ncbi:putative transcriptional regulatory protein [Trichoderma ghanense]|uniref:Transcriptional regulatory protein n=1 Tax=Trichoderma ghanense TaxID=65468 RepID=A0ABY2HBK3_9HYPO
MATARSFSLMTKSCLSAAPRASRSFLVCPSCSRPFGATASRSAGHNKWSKTKHIKAVTDKKKMSERVSFTKLITMYSKMYGEDIRFNPQLANAVAAATKASVPKALIEGAIARGQGRSTTGAQLEPMTLEILMPPNIALVADIETDNKTRSLHDLKFVVKKAGGLVGSTAFYFSRRGRAVFKPRDDGPSLSDVLEEAIEHEGTEDVEEHPDGGYVVWTEPSKLMAITEAISKHFELEVVESEILWAANEDTKADVDSPELVESLNALLSGLREHTEVRALFANIRQGAITDEEWDKLERHIDI